MSRKFTDLSQLSKAVVKTAPKAAVSEPAPPPAKPRDEGAEEVLAYFARPTGDQTARVSSRKGARSSAPQAAPKETDTSDDAIAREVESLRVQLSAAEAARADAEARADEADRARTRSAEELAVALKEVERLKGECGRLQGEARKALREQSDAAPAPDVASAVGVENRSGADLLTPPRAFDEAFAGELREMVLAALSDARDAAHQSGRERRAAVLDAVLAVNKSTGELARRRAMLEQVMKDAGYYTDPRALAPLGIQLVSGRKHWKLDYAGIRITMAKTPSDYRANRNTSSDMANRCF